MKPMLRDLQRNTCGLGVAGESLSPRFFERAAADLPAADLLIVMGTSLVVHPFAGLIGTCTRPGRKRLTCITV